MTTTNDNIRQAHKLLDCVAEGRAVLDEEVRLLRSFLPELPKQMSLKEICEFVDNAAYGTRDNMWRDDVHGDLAPFLHEVSSQLKGLIDDKSAAVPALPEGMRLADHKDYGRVIVSPRLDIDDCYEVYHLDLGMSSGTDISGVEPDSLTFIHDEPFAPAHPEFLETVEDYENAPNGTIAASAKASPAMKGGRWWESSPYMDRDAKTMAGEPRRVLRWGWGE